MLLYAVTMCVHRASWGLSAPILTTTDQTLVGAQHYFCTRVLVNNTQALVALYSRDFFFE